MPLGSTALLRTQSDERLLHLAQAGHERAFEAIVHRYRKPLLRHCRRVLPEARAEDALQQALLHAWTALRRGDDVHDLRPWLYRIAHNTSVNALRVAGYDYDELAESVRVVDAPEDELERRAVVRQTLAGIAALPEAQREALLRTVLEGDSQALIARDLGLSHGAVRQLVHRARTSLRTAATAVVPLPIAEWLAALGGHAAQPLTVRVAEMAAGGASAAGLSATLAKGGAVAVVAAGAVTAPAVVEKQREASREATRAALVAAPAPSASARARLLADPTATATPTERVLAQRTGGSAGAAGSGGEPRRGKGPRSSTATPFDDSGSGLPGERSPGARDVVEFDDSGPESAATPTPTAQPTPAGGGFDLPGTPTPTGTGGDPGTGARGGGSDAGSAGSGGGEGSGAPIPPPLRGDQTTGGSEPPGGDAPRTGGGGQGGGGQGGGDGGQQPADPPPPPESAEQVVDRVAARAQRAAERAAAQTQREAERAAAQTQREAERAAAQAQREAERAAAQAQREAERAAAQALRLLERAGRRAERAAP